MKRKDLLTASERRKIEKLVLDKFSHLPFHQFLMGAERVIRLYCRFKLSMINHMASEGIKSA